MRKACEILKSSSLSRSADELDAGAPDELDSSDFTMVGDNWGKDVAGGQGVGMRTCWIQGRGQKDVDGCRTKGMQEWNDLSHVKHKTFVDFLEQEVFVDGKLGIGPVGGPDPDAG